MVFVRVYEGFRRAYKAHRVYIGLVGYLSEFVGFIGL